MTTEKRQPIYKNIQLTLSRIIEDWQMKDKVTLFGHLVIYEAILHWIWVAVVYINRSYFELYILQDELLMLFLGCTVFIACMVLIIYWTEQTHHNKHYFLLFQILMLSFYTIYIFTFLMLLGQDSFLTGVSLIGFVVIAMLLMEREVVRWVFIIQCFLVVFLMSAPIYLGELPSLKQNISTLYLLFNSEEGVDKYNTFWRMSHLFLGLPKVIIIAYTVRKLLDAIESRKEFIRQQAEYDDLTKIRNRRSLINVARYNLRHGNHINDTSIMIIDLDFFKNINDKYGHLAGDEVLHEVAQLLKNHIPEGGEIGRYGGEEFLVVLPNTDKDRAMVIAEDLRGKIESHAICIDAVPVNMGKNRQVNMTASFGIASLPFEHIQNLVETDKATLDSNRKSQLDIRLDGIIKVGIDNADIALYEAKNSGRNRVVASREIGYEQLKQLIPLSAI